MMKLETVAKAAKLLDAVCPGWAEEIDCDMLDMHDWNQCILGQLYGRYRGAPKVLMGNRVFSENEYLDEWVYEISTRLNVPAITLEGADILLRDMKMYKQLLSAGHENAAAILLQDVLQYVEDLATH